MKQLKVEADVAVQVSYYNECLAAWEPLLEPVIIEEQKAMWEVQLKVTALYLKLLKSKKYSGFHIIRYYQNEETGHEKS